MKRYTIKPTATPSQFVVNYEQELNPEQLEVVMAGGGPILVIAGAGSGKTRTVTYRVARLIESGVDPSHILLITFTNRAAKEMLHRVELLIGQNVKKVWGGTFHHVGNLILRHHAKLLGYESNFTILDQEDSKDLINACVADLKIKTKERRFPQGDVLQNIISLSFNTKANMDDIILDRYPFFYTLLDEIIMVARRYQERKKKLNLMDFDDLLLNWERLLLTSPEIHSLYGKRFQYILVDEYQDTNKIQADIVDLLASHHRNLMVVGDDSQSIYSFRGANFANIIDFPGRYPDVTVYKLETNYRSVPEILSLANYSISRNERQFPKNLKAVRRSGVQPSLIPVNDVMQQASFVAQRMLELRDEEGMSLDEMAVLYRAHYHSMELQMELTRRGIPFEVRSGLKFFEQAHIKDVTGYLKVMVNPRDELAWKRILRLIPRIGKVSSEKIWDYIQALPDPFPSLTSEALVPFATRNAQPHLNRFTHVLKKLYRPELQKSPAEMIELVMEEGYEEYLQAKYPNFEARIEDIKQLRQFALQYNSTEDFLSELALLSGMEAEDAVGGGYEDERVKLSTVHQAKGLEWSVVFVIWLCDGRFPSMRSLKTKEDEEEERRLFYVSVTRAKDHLYLCYPILAYDYNQPSILLRPSRFIQEIPEKAYEKWAVEED